jgi:hypothetical protein
MHIVYGGVQNFVFTFLAPCCDVRYYFHIKMMFGFVVTRSLLYYVCLFAHSGVKHFLTIWLAWRVYFDSMISMAGVFWLYD